MKVVIFLAFFALAMADKQMWEDFKTTYGKTYAANEEARRFAIFEQNLVKAAEFDAADAHATYGVTPFMDLHVDEFRANYLMDKAIHKNYTFEEGRLAEKVPAPAAGLPTSFDWRDKGAITAVYNQGQCGSCWAFSATETIESYNEICGNGLNHESMQQIVDCDTTAYGCNGGWTSSAYNYIEQAGGIEPLADYPYTAVTGSCQFDASKINEKITGWKYVTQSADESAMQNWCNSNGPLSVCVDAASWQFYTGGVITSCGQQVDHCVQVTGWSTQQGTPAWNVRNSWGTSWGIDGYLYVERGQNMCAIGSTVTSVSCT
jgi:C1A family cysteine protease